MGSQNANVYTDFLMDVHSVHAGLTERSIGAARTPEGQSSYEAFCSFADPQPGMTVVDLACGNGPLSEVLSKRVGRCGKVIGVDLSDAELKLASVRLRGLPNVRLLRESADQLSLPDVSADFVLCHMALMLFTPLRPVVKEIGRVLKSGGGFAAVVPTLRNPTALFRECASALRSVLSDEKHPLGALSDNAVKMNSVADLQALFAGDEWQQTGISTFDIDVSIAAPPEALVNLVAPAFYHYQLLSAEARHRVELKWAELFKQNCDSSEITRFHYPLSAFRLRKR